MNFAYPWAFLALVPLVAIGWIRWRRRASVALAYPVLDAAPTRRPWRAWLLFIPPVLQTLAAVGVVCALARPQKEVLATKDVREGIAIMTLLDISSSMQMEMGFEGKKANRLEVAKKVLENFVAGNDTTLGGRKDDLVGLVTFARFADTVCPLTLSHDAVIYLTREVEVQDRPNEDGTAYGDATALAAAHLKKYEELQQDSEESLSKDAVVPEIKSKIIVLLTDGENNCGNHLPEQAAAMAKHWGIRIYTISFGDPPKKKLVKATDGSDVSLPLEQSPTEGLLRLMAEQTGGIFRRASSFDTLEAVYAEIDQLEKSELKPVKYKEMEDNFSIFVLSVLGLLVVDIFLRTTLLRTVP